MVQLYDAPWPLPDSLDGIGTIDGTVVPCVSVQAQRALHTGYELPTGTGRTSPCSATSPEARLNVSRGPGRGGPGPGSTGGVSDRGRPDRCRVVGVVQDVGLAPRRRADEHQHHGHPGPGQQRADREARERGRRLGGPVDERPPEGGSAHRGGGEHDRCGEHVHRDLTSSSRGRAGRARRARGPGPRRRRRTGSGSGRRARRRTARAAGAARWRPAGGRPAAPAGRTTRTAEMFCSSACRLRAVRSFISAWDSSTSRARKPPPSVTRSASSSRCSRPGSKLSTGRVAVAQVRRDDGQAEGLAGRVDQAVEVLADPRARWTAPRRSGPGRGSRRSRRAATAGPAGSRRG